MEWLPFPILAVPLSLTEIPDVDAEVAFCNGLICVL
jgi:hypothetical protein